MCQIFFAIFNINSSDGLTKRTDPALHRQKQNSLSQHYVNLRRVKPGEI